MSIKTPEIDKGFEEIRLLRYAREISPHTYGKAKYITVGEALLFLGCPTGKLLNIKV